jgi:hypothetical protein
MSSSITDGIIVLVSALFSGDPFCGAVHSIEWSRILASGSHDQYTTIVRSKPSQMVLNHPKRRRAQG